MPGATTTSGLSAARLYAGAKLLHSDIETLPERIVEDPLQDRSVKLRVHLPAGDGPFPVVVFSHGSFCGYTEYDQLTARWAGHGYVVVMPCHPDALEAPAPTGPPDLMLLLSQRLRDMSLALDVLPEITGLPAPDHAVAAGHSFGALTAMIKLGLPLAAGSYQFGESPHDARFVAGISLSGVGHLPPLTEDAFTHLNKPVIATGGTLDEGNVGSGPVFPWEWRLSAYDLAPPGDKYRVAIDKADHYLGGLIARSDRGGEADAGGVEILSAVTCAFLDAYLRADASAQDWLARIDLYGQTQGRAKLEHK